MRVRRRDFLIAGTAAIGGLGIGLAGGRELATPSPPDTRMFGISMTGSDPAAVDAAKAVGEALDRPAQVLNFFMAWHWRLPFPTATVEAIRRAGAIPEITWEPWDPREGAVQRDYRLDNLSQYDGYIDEYARACAEWGHEINIRFAHEMNSDWYPWAVTVNGGSPPAYVAAHRHVRQRFTAAGATNVRWVWCPNVVHRGRSDLIRDSYPGDDVVDVVALDGYNRDGRTSPQDLFGPSLDLITDVASDKPLWINEVGCVPMPGQARWVSDLFAFLKTTPVACVVWFELDHPDHPNWTLLSTQATAEAGRRSIASW